METEEIRFIKIDSIEYLGEDGDRFRYVFNGETCKEVYPKIEWE